MKEKVVYIDESVHEFDVFKLGYRKVRQLIQKHLPLDKITLDKDKNPVMPDDFKMSSMFELMEDCINTIKGIDIEQIQAEELGRLYKTHFEASIKMGLGGKGNPN